jgi:Tfp pilus assembly protein PilN
MSAPLYQQINLYQPIFRKQRQIFSAAAMLSSVGVVAVALLGIYAFGLWQVAGLEREAVQLEGREKAYSAQLARLDPTSGAQRREQIERELERLSATVIRQQKLVDVLRKRSVSSTEGFSANLAALARRHVAGLWLTKISINGASGAIELAGRAVGPALVPEYLQSLSEEPALSGQRFDRLQIERDENSSMVQFRVTSRAVDPDVWRETLASRSR